MKVLIDFHHEELFHSLQLLFEKRLGWEVYRQIGLEWQQEGYWNVYPHPDTAKQFLELGCFTVDRYPLNGDFSKQEEGIFRIKNFSKNTVQKAITLDRFKQEKFDIVISSVPQHISLFNNLIATYQPQAKHIFQVGNAWGHTGGVRNVLASTAPFKVPQGTNICFYHQEFDLDVFKYEAPTEQNYKDKKINSYVHWMKGLDLLQEFKVNLEDFKFTTYGAGMDSDLSKTSDVAQAMRESMWTWHYKPEGDGYGHAVHSTYAMGRPQIVKKNFYNGKLASALMEDQKTCIDISLRTVQESSRLIRLFSRVEEHSRMCENAHKKFQSVVNFDYEFLHTIKPFLERVLN